MARCVRDTVTSRRFYPKSKIRSSAAKRTNSCLVNSIGGLRMKRKKKRARVLRYSIKPEGSATSSKRLDEVAEPSGFIEYLSTLALFFFRFIRRPPIEFTKQELVRLAADDLILDFG